MLEQLQYLKARYDLRSAEGATAVEYGIMVALIAIVIIIAVTLLGTTLRELFFDVATGLGGETGTG